MYKFFRRSNSLFVPLYSILFVIAVQLPACKKPNLDRVGSAIGNSGPNCCTVNLSAYSLQLKKLNNHPAGSRLVVERFGHPKADSSTIYQSILVEKNIPFADTTLLMLEITNYSMYAKWKVLSATNDSLFGGKTPTMVTGGNVVFEINY